VTWAGSCPIRVTLAEPVEADGEAAGMLRSAFGVDLKCRWQRWLLYLTQGADEPPAQLGLAARPAAAYAGPLDRVTVETQTEPPVLSGGEDEITACIRMVAGADRDTMRVLARQASVVGKPWVGRYVSIVADRYDERGLRVERVAGSRCMVRPFEVEYQPPWLNDPVQRRLFQPMVWSVEVRPCDGLWWWAPAGRTAGGGADG
jgi:hypothetical protein